VKAVAPLVLLVALAACAKGEFTVCADPNNMPFSDARGAGIENKLAELLAREQGKPLRYVWWKQRRGWVRNTLGEGKCDAWMGVASSLDALETTRPYYRAGYVFVSRKDRPFAGLTLDDPRLRSLKIGVQLVGDDGANPPPADALARRGLTERVRGFMLYGDDRRPEPAGDVVHAVEAGEVDLALVWGPVAGWEAARSAVPLRLEPVTPWLDQGRWPMAFDISVGVAKGDTALRRKLDIGLARNRAVIARILASFHVPPASGG
jgi:mxaJ protein